MADHNPARVILWSTPRSVSTAFLKCITFVDRSIAWHEPFIFANRCAPDGTIRAIIEKTRRDEPSTELPLIAEYQTLKHKHFPSALCSSSDNIYEASNHSFSWIKQQLEAPQPGKDLIFVKDMVQGIDGHYYGIPDGFRHTFLMRHPLKVFDSFKRMYLRAGKQNELTQLPEMIIPSGKFFKELYDLLMYVKLHHDPEPVVIDADDLLEDPEGILSAYCTSTGISYSQNLLQWPAGTDEVLNRWIIQKEVLCVPRLLEVFRKCFDSTCFGPPMPLPDRNELPEDVLQLADSCMPYYEKLYEQRLRAK
ncbi:uncharacterized protein [Amphiura filiformis]|uniref:uncharacterized protein n=1 Tax=Amphiura filiformis TaxID=82378 RepID=UPI003B226730